MKKQEIFDNDTLLQYQVSSSPSPLEVSTKTDTSGDLIFEVVSSKTVLCKSITIAVPIGDKAIELYLTGSSLTGSTNSNQWQITSDFVQGKTLGLFDVNYKVFLLKNRSGNHIVPDSFRIVLTGTTNTMLGVASVDLFEESSVVDNPEFSKKNRTFNIYKSAPSFYVRNFMASTVTSSSIPATEYKNGESINLSWESNGKSYEIYKKGETVPIVTTTKTAFEVKDGISSDTTFVVRAISGDNNLMDALTLTVSNPTLTPLSIEVIENATIHGTTTNIGQTTLANTKITGDLKVENQQSTFGNVEINSYLNVTAKNTNAVNLGASGNLSAEGNTVVNTFRSTGASNIDGPVVIKNATITESIILKNSKVKMFNGIETMPNGDGFNISSKAYRALTDGLLMCTIDPYYVDKICNAYGYLYVSSKPQYFMCEGGSTGTFHPNNSPFRVPKPGNLSIPVESGSVFGYSGVQAKTNEGNTLIKFYWVSLGALPDGQKSYEKLSNNNIPPPPDMSKYMAENKNIRIKERVTIANDLVTVLEQMLDKEIDSNHKKDIVKLLLKF